MSRRSVIACSLLWALVLPGVPSGRALPQAPPAAQGDAPLPLVPINVRVLDRSGRPVTDLKQADFTVLEEGAPQEIRYCAFQPLAPEAAQPGSPLAVRGGIALAPQKNRVFVILLGLGRLEQPSKTLSGLIRFAKTKLLPQDQVAIFAYNRALAFTNDQAQLVAALERLKKSHEDIAFEMDLQLGPTSMASLYGTRVLPRKLQTKIDETVLGPGAKPSSAALPEIIDAPKFAGLSLDDFMFTTSQTVQDQGNLLAVAEYLRRYEGEKHILFVTEKGLLWPSDENDQALASIANDGRTTIHTLQAGGVLAAEEGREMLATQQQAMSFRSLRTLSTLTGGLPAITEQGQSALDRLDEVTRSSYLVGFRSSNAAWDGGYRKLVVRVNRPDVTVLYRHGYFRDNAAPGFNRRGFVTNDRLAAAGNFRREVNDIKVKVAVSHRPGGSMAAEGKIDMAKVKLATVDGERVGLLDVAVFCLDSGNNPMGTHVQTLPIKLAEGDYQRVLKDGLPFTVQFPVIGGTQSVRFIVYDFASDLVGRMDTRVF